jgi:hypothetical protein
MRKVIGLGLVFLFLGGSIASGSKADPSAIVRGDYVEVRTASVFAGACHYNGELTTTGRDALLAWNVKSGSWNGVDLSGVRALAVVSADDNLAGAAKRRSQLTIDSEVSYSQSVAMVKALQSRFAATLGEIVAVKQAPVSFLREGKNYSVASSGIATIEVESMPDDLCCRMPHLVWYEPLVPLSNRKVGHTKKASYYGDLIGEPWQRSGENGAFYGEFSF